MTYKRFYDAKEFYSQTYEVLLRHEAQNSLPLGNVVLGNNGGEAEGWKNVKNWYMATVADQSGNILLVAIMTPSFNITLYEADNIPNQESLDCLCTNLKKENVAVPGVTSENSLAERFAKAYTKIMGMEYRVKTNLRIYTLNQVDKSVPLIGNIRRAEKKDLCFLPYWDLCFQDDCHLGSFSLEDSFAATKNAIERKTLFILEDDGMPVSMASAAREVINSRRVGLIYTPPYLRGKGYASSCVAQVSQILLDMGYQFAALFTDLANPTSNSIYQKIGYRPVCDYNELTFIQK